MSNDPFTYISERYVRVIWAMVLLVDALRNPTDLLMNPPDQAELAKRIAGSFAIHF